MSSKKILFVLPEMPWPLDRGGNQAMYNGIDCLRCYYDIFVVYPIYTNENTDTEIEALTKRWPDVHIRPFFIKGKKNISFLRSIFGKLFRKMGRILLDERCTPPTYAQKMINHFKIDDKALFEFVDDIIKSESIDILQVEMVWKSTIGLGFNDNVKRVFVHHELRYVCHEIELGLGMDVITPYNIAAYQLAKIMEIGILNKYDAVITLSKVDKEKLKSAGVTVPLYESKAIVQSRDFDPNNKPNIHTLYFVGPENHNPNKEAVLWFLKNCWNKLRQIDSNYRFKVIGNWSNKTINELTNRYSGISFLGFVDDIANVLRQGITIVPLTIGSGIRMKILESANIGSPVITTTVGVEGLPLENNHDCLIADTPDDFINAIVRLKDQKLMHKLTTNANSIIRKDFSLESLRESRISIYNSL